MDGDDYLQEEFGRRTIEIGNLRDVLFGEKDRVAEAQDRHELLLQNIANTRAELGIRRSKANELEDKAALGEAGLEDATRALAADRIAGVAEVAKIRQEMEQSDLAASKAQGGLHEARRQLSERSLEATAMRGRLAALRRDLDRAREALAADEAAEQERQARLVAQRGSEGGARLTAAKAALQAAEDEAAAMQQRLRQCESELAMEKGSCEELRLNLEQKGAQSAKLAQDCDALRRELSSLEQDKQAMRMREALQSSKRQCQRLSQEVANVRRQALMQTQSIQGALDETRRMLSDHLDQTHRHVLEQTTRTDSSLGVFVLALSNARAKTASAAAAKKSLEDVGVSLEAEVRQLEEALAAERVRARSQRSDEAVASLATARSALEAANKKATSAAEEARRAEDIAADTVLASGEQERVLKAKLEQLWAAVRQYGSLGNPGTRAEI